MVLGASPREGGGHRCARRRVTVTWDTLREQRGGAISHRPVSRIVPRIASPSDRGPDGRSPSPRAKPSSLQEGHPREAPLRSSEANDPATRSPTNRERPGGSRAKEHATTPQVQRTGTRDEDPLGPTPWREAPSNQPETPGGTRRQRQVQRPGRRSRLSPAGKATPPSEDSPAGAPRSAATQAPGGRATHRTRARSAQVLAQTGAPRHVQPGRAAAKRSTERRRTAGRTRRTTTRRT